MTLNIYGCVKYEQTKLFNESRKCPFDPGLKWASILIEICLYLTKQGLKQQQKMYNSQTNLAW